jgi:hypothetical protein
MSFCRRTYDNSFILNWAMRYSPHIELLCASYLKMPLAPTRAAVTLVLTQEGYKIGSNPY